MHNNGQYCTGQYPGQQHMKGHDREHVCVTQPFLETARELLPELR